jgi:hypothetical protein
MSDIVTIARRFHGPPSSGNGGYTCGILAAFIDGPAVVRLKAPPPVETPFTIEREGDAVRLVTDGQVYAKARPTTLDLLPPKPPSFEAAAEASKGFRGFHDHYYSSCFVCGPDREVGDGLRIFAGPLPDASANACVWTPDASLDDGAGHVRSEFIWAALDCPGAFTFGPPETGSILLGELAVKILGPVVVGESYRVMGWEVEHDGRKHKTGTAIFDKDGTCLGIGRGTWIEVPQAAL